MRWRWDCQQKRATWHRHGAFQLRAILAEFEYAAEEYQSLD